ncbi:FAD/NAD(P)-binding domain-containing protein [Aspergillus ellipticus CBS 707.79]|uniref:FAD/NAD(P)-binding domain-containing protein n=1 Tax=Aspergillus ellipticus CBS 707.79 TaxID=1448320 RepID=A0A319E8K6_9EURO|nr:FAD/NAD(P)-binding domain-containing protein [Aspergillus ellipticus CBS 707.79]
MDTYKDTFTLPRPSAPLHALVVGAGIAGLTVALDLHHAGHRVTIIERVRMIAEVGAGIQMAPNAARILSRLGLLDEVMQNANVLEKNSLRIYRDDEELGAAPLMPGMAAHHNAKDICQPTGHAAYRIMIPKDRMQGDQRALRLLGQNVGMRWMGPGGHIMAYPIKNNTVYNMVLVHPQEGVANEESWTRKGDKKQMKEFYSEWNDLIRSLLSYAPDGEIMEWTLNSHFPLPTWIENRVVLMGDACHPMLPYVAQGAAQAIEDAGVLACVLSLTEDIDSALAVYERVRKERAEKIQKSAAVTRKALHLPDGEEQRKRDEAIRGPGKNPDLWADHDWQDFMWGTDVMKETVDNFEDLVARSHGYHPHALNAVAY